MRIIKKINKHKTTGQLTITIPKEAGLTADDYVEVVKVPDMNNGGKENGRQTENN